MHSRGCNRTRRTRGRTGGGRRVDRCHGQRATHGRTPSWDGRGDWGALRQWPVKPGHHRHVRHRTSGGAGSTRVVAAAATAATSVAAAVARGGMAVAEVAVARGEGRTSNRHQKTRHAWEDARHRRRVRSQSRRSRSRQGRGRGRGLRRAPARRRRRRRRRSLSRRSGCRRGSRTRRLQSRTLLHSAMYRPRPIGRWRARCRPRSNRPTHGIGNRCHRAPIESCRSRGSRAYQQSHAPRGVASLWRRRGQESHPWWASLTSLPPPSGGCAARRTDAAPGSHTRSLEHDSKCGLLV